ncbi:1-(5-phosphoribosyl)-5-[(5-phosphoribosylamino)methylideneamino] imidazole-4-carboxamide isomerase [Geodia barretti]|uniref:1-(5-phosphoribosyl)-5-[(5-phosphoribosylamino)me thylideneamino] imidazole-4-carboxamide isomerase n=1 Tax=Geodia barretti TaxID=519541 RepID=A0AA35SQW8_GEOBA|nr:1-(5-phosphoribosyl)-5-[(5-phosphoribosylamino)methylideneamino] imidazole-4-carboxamide isomerase [Geodia barretti]
MLSIRERGLFEIIRHSIDSGKPFLGVCLGLQLLLESSEEGEEPCLAILKGSTKRLPPEKTDQVGLKIPHMGWNSVSLSVQHPVFEGIPNDSYFYFVHSYYADPEDKDIVAGVTNYGIDFCSAEGSGMEVIPAIDLRGGKCVRLYQGDYAQETVYSDDPLETALRWVDMGATRLHIVDLDGARDGSPANLAAVERISSAAGVPVHLGGGIRDLNTARTAIDSGVSRIMLGTAAVEDADLISTLLSEIGNERVIVSVDAKDGRVALHGWLQGSDALATDLVADMAALGVKRFLYTDISRDGTLTEPNFDGVSALVNQGNIRLIAAGGIATVAHLQRLARPWR